MVTEQLSVTRGPHSEIDPLFTPYGRLGQADIGVELPQNEIDCLFLGFSAQSSLDSINGILVEFCRLFNYSYKTFSAYSMTIP